jgi:hypothetical protein
MRLLCRFRGCELATVPMPVDGDRGGCGSASLTKPALGASSTRS